MRKTNGWWQGEKYLDGRELLSWWEELDSEREQAIEEYEEKKKKLEEIDDPERLEEEEVALERESWELKHGQRCMDSWDEEQEKEWEDLRVVEDEISRDSSLISEEAWEEYARQTAEDLLPRGSLSGWPFDYIDWERAADALQSDYSQIEIAGTTYYYRD